MHKNTFFSLAAHFLKVLSNAFFGGIKTSAGSRLFALLLGSCLLSEALRPYCLLWLWSPHLTGPLGELYFTSWLARNAEKSPREPVSHGDQSQRRREDRRATLRRREPQRESNQRKKSGALYGRRERGKFFGSGLLKNSISATRRAGQA